MLLKTSCGEKKVQSASAPAMLVSWGARAVYIGPGLQLAAHRNAVAVLALALKTPLSVALDARDFEQGCRVCRSVLIEPNQLHLIEMDTHDHAFIYLDALSPDLAALRANCLEPGGKLNFDLINERILIDLLVQMPRNKLAWIETAPTLAKNLGFIQRQEEPRIRSVVQALLLGPGDTRPAADWASEIGLSSSRFQHLFKEHVGISFRRFRLWARVRVALRYAMQGTSLTHAAMAAGFLNSAHFSTAFKSMFGIPPSQLIGVSPLYIET